MTSLILSPFLLGLLSSIPWFFPSTGPRSRPSLPLPAPLASPSLLSGFLHSALLWAKEGSSLLGTSLACPALFLLSLSFCDYTANLFAFPCHLPPSSCPNLGGTCTTQFCLHFFPSGTGECCAKASLTEDKASVQCLFLSVL